MWSVISKLVLRLAALRWILKLGGLGLLVPIAFLLKVVGLPLLAILSVLALPVLILLFLFGLPIFLVLIVGGMIMTVMGMVLTIGIAVVKIGIFVVLPIWLMWLLVCAIKRGCKRSGGCDGDDKGPANPSSGATPDATPPGDGTTGRAGDTPPGFEPS